LVRFEDRREIIDRLDARCEIMNVCIGGCAIQRRTFHRGHGPWFRLPLPVSPSVESVTRAETQVTRPFGISNHDSSTRSANDDRTRRHGPRAFSVAPDYTSLRFSSLAD